MRIGQDAGLQPRDAERLAQAGTVLENRKLKTKAMMMPEITIGMTKIVRSAVLNRIRESARRPAGMPARSPTITVTAAKPNVNR